MSTTEASYIFMSKLCVAHLNFGEIGMMKRSSYDSHEADDTAVTYHQVQPCSFVFTHIYM